jgi:hypothetical protein
LIFFCNSETLNVITQKKDTAYKIFSRPAFSVKKKEETGTVVGKEQLYLFEFRGSAVL